ncbi:UNVERIFIED_CONTAM: hypothetical protein ABID98_003904 [Brevibacillus sp. OAP136]
MKPVLVWETNRKTAEPGERSGNVIPFGRNRSGEVVEQESIRTEWKAGSGKNGEGSEEPVTITMVSSGFTTKARAVAPQSAAGTTQMRLAA